MSEEKIETLKTVMIESPYSGDIESNVKYAYDCVRDSYLRGELPFAPHLLWTKISINDEDNGKDHYSDNNHKHNVNSREHALQGCRVMRCKLGHVVFYLDRGWSSGMKRAFKEAKEDNIPVEARYLNPVNKEIAKYGFDLL